LTGNQCLWLWSAKARLTPLLSKKEKKRKKKRKEKKRKEKKRIIQKELQAFKIF